MEFFKKMWNAEPAMVVGFIRSMLLVAVAFGLNITDEQQAAILAFAAASLAMSAITRGQVVPVHKVEDKLTEKQAEKLLEE